MEGVNLICHDLYWMDGWMGGRKDNLSNRCIHAYFLVGIISRGAEGKGVCCSVKNSLLSICTVSRHIAVHIF